MNDMSEQIGKTVGQVAAQIAKIKSEEVARDTVLNQTRDLQRDIALLEARLTDVVTKRAAADRLVESLDPLKAEVAYREAVEEARVTKRAQHRIQQELSDHREVCEFITKRQTAIEEVNEALSKRIDEAHQKAMVLFEALEGLAVEKADERVLQLRAEVLAAMSGEITKMQGALDVRWGAEAERIDNQVQIEKRKTAATRGTVTKALGDYAGEVERLQEVIEKQRASGKRMMQHFSKQATEVIEKLQAKITHHGEHVSQELLPRKFKGPWAPNSEYSRGDMVMYLGSTWLSTRATSAMPSASMGMSGSEPDWHLFAAAGIGGAMIEGGSTAKGSSRTITTSIDGGVY